jgi:hypothetical protein
LTRGLARAAVGAAAAWGLALLAVQVRHPEPFLNDAVLHTGLLRAMADAPANGQSLLDPWVGAWGLGFPVFHYYQSLPHFLVLGLWKMSFGGMSLITAFQTVLWLALGTLPVPVYLGCRKLGARRAGAAAAAVLLPLIRTDYLHGLELESSTWQGLGQFTQAVGIWFLPLGLAWSWMALRTGRGLARAALLMTATFLSHLALGYMAFLALGLAALLHPREIPARIARLAAVATITVLASAPVVVPILREFAYYNISTLVPMWKYLSFGHAEVLAKLAQGDLLDFGRFPVITILAGAGLVRAAILARRRETERGLLVFFLFFLALFFGRPTWGRLLDLLPLGSGFHFSRALTLVQWTAVIAAGLAVGDALERVARARAGTVAALLLAATIAAVPVVERTGYLRRNAALIREAAAEYAAERDDLNAAIAAARGDGERRVYAGLGAAGDPHAWGGSFMVGWVPVYAYLPVRGVDAFGYLHHMWSLNSDLFSAFDERREHHYRIFNIGAVIAPPGQPTHPLAQETASFGRFTVHEFDSGGFLELVDAPYTVDVAKKDIPRLHRTWLTGPLARTGLHPMVHLREAGGQPPGTAHAIGGYDLRLPSATPPPGPRGEVLSASRSGDDFFARVRVDRECRLLLKMTYHPAWKATVNGDDAPVAHLLPSYCAVPLSPGTHEVRFRYSPGRGRLFLTLAGLSVLLAALAAERRFGL